MDVQTSRREARFLSKHFTTTTRRDHCVQATETERLVARLRKVERMAVSGSFTKKRADSAPEGRRRETAIRLITVSVWKYYG
jgi:hypothetical protein